MPFPDGEQGIGFLTCQNAQQERPFFGAGVNRHDIAYQSFSQACRSLSLTPKLIDWHNLENVEACRAVVVAAPWDYTSYPDLFLDTLSNISNKASLINSEDVIRWNFNKKYLMELEKEGFPTIRTTYYRNGSLFDPSAVSQEFQTKKIVLKPAVGSGGEAIHLIEKTDNPITVQFDTIAQPFVESVTSFGEVSAMFVTMEITHAVRKIPAPSSILVHQRHFGRLEPYSLSNLQNQQITRVIKYVSRKGATFGRIDFFIPNEEEILLSEVELIDPECFTQFYPGFYKPLVESVLA